MREGITLFPNKQLLFLFKLLFLRKLKIIAMKKGDKVMISPDLTNLSEWISGVIIDVEENTFAGIVISANTETNGVFFGKEYLFKPQNDYVVCTH